MVPMSGPSNFRYDPCHQFDRLSSLLNTLPTSEWVHPLRCEIKGYPSFFPGGRGYLGPAFPQSPVMLIGHNFDNKENFLLSVARGYEEEKRRNTWGILREFFLPVADLAEQDCFFTNFYLGAIIHPEPEPGAEKKTSNTGHFKCSPSREEAANYREACVDALRQQVETVRPSVVALLGSVVPRYFFEGFSFVPRLRRQGQRWTVAGASAWIQNSGGTSESSNQSAWKRSSSTAGREAEGGNPGTR